MSIPLITCDNETYFLLVANDGMVLVILVDVQGMHILNLNV